MYRDEPAEAKEAPQPRWRARESERSAEPPAVNRIEPILAPIQQVSVRKGTDDVLPQASVVKGYEYEKNRFVAVEPEELKSIAPKTSTGMDIQEFVQLSEIDPVYFETSYYIAPEEAGEKAYALLYRSLARDRIGCDRAICDAQPRTRRGVTPR